MKKRFFLGSKMIAMAAALSAITQSLGCSQDQMDETEGMDVSGGKTDSTTPTTTMGSFEPCGYADGPSDGKACNSAISACVEDGADLAECVQKSGCLMKCTVDPVGNPFCPGGCLQLAQCGDGEVNNPEENCDREACAMAPSKEDMDACVAASTCSMACTWMGTAAMCQGCDGDARCGDKISNKDPATAVVDECDNGDDGNKPAEEAAPADCTKDCRIACGDGFKGLKEACDPSVANAGCNDDCTLSCGDGMPDPGEECDDGSGNVDPGVGGVGKCTTECRNGCGDSQPGSAEACDNGPENGDTAKCTSECALAVCGDGKVLKGDEECDDGNQIETDFCLKTCKLAKCGDGVVQAGAEECDDNNMIDGDACTNQCMRSRRVIFVTSSNFTGNLGGLGGGDSKCAEAAKTAGLPAADTFRAWLSDGKAVDARLDSAFMGIYTLSDMTTVVADEGWADLSNGTPDKAISMTEFKEPAPNSTPWTGTKSDGGPDNANCMGWGTTSGAVTGLTGFTGARLEKWTQNVPSSCNNLQPLYCIQGPHPAP